MVGLRSANFDIRTPSLVKCKSTRRGGFFLTEILGFEGGEIPEGGHPPWTDAGRCSLATLVKRLTDNIQRSVNKDFSEAK